MRTFDSEALRTASGDVFGRIYEYFLAEFSKQGAHDNGEFFTPPSIVQTIVNVIEPDHGLVLDPACGSGGMFVQSSHFIEDAGEDTMKRVTFYGHEKNETTAKLAQVNLAVHGLEGRIRAGNEAITYYKDPHESGQCGQCDFVMANPPFNVDEVDAGKVKGDKRLPFGLPGVNKAKKVSNANYLWLQYFYSYLNENGRAGVVMSSQASSAGRDEARVRRKLIESGAVDVMIDVRGNFFYTRTVPCQLWFFDRAKERDPERAGRVLDARCAQHPSQGLARGLRLQPRAAEEHRRHRMAVSRAVGAVPRSGRELPRPVHRGRWHHRRAARRVRGRARQAGRSGRTVRDFAIRDRAARPRPACRALGGAHLCSSQGIRRLRGVHRRSHAVRRRLERMERRRQRRGAGQPRPPRGARKPARHGGALPESDATDRSGRQACPAAWSIRRSGSWKLGIRIAGPTRRSARRAGRWRSARASAVEALRRARHFVHQADWLQERFPDARLRDVEGLVKLVERAEVEAHDWSLTPGRYVGVAPEEEDEDFDFAEAMRSIHVDLKELNEEAVELAARIARNFEELGV